MATEVKDILIKKEGWKEFISPLHKKITPVIIPSIALGYFFYNITNFFIHNTKMSDIKSKLFVIAIIFLYLWFLLQIFMLSCWIYTILQSYSNKKQNRNSFLKLKKFGKDVA